MADNRHVFVYVLVEYSGLGRRQIDTAVGTVGLIDLPSETAAPVGIMKADSAVKRHPVFYRGRIIFSPQNLVFLLVVQAKDSRRGCPVFGYVAGHKG